MGIFVAVGRDLNERARNDARRHPPRSSSAEPKARDTRASLPEAQPRGPGTLALAIDNSLQVRGRSAEKWPLAPRRPRDAGWSDTSASASPGDRNRRSIGREARSTACSARTPVADGSRGSRPRRADIRSCSRSSSRTPKVDLRRHPHRPTASLRRPDSSAARPTPHYPRRTVNPRNSDNWCPASDSWERAAPEARARCPR